MKTSQAFATKVPAAKITRGPMPTSEQVRPYLPMVRKVVAGFLRRVPRSVLKEDLIAAGNFGLLDALRKGPADRGPAFEWYVRLRIRGAVLDELRAHDWLTREARKAVREPRGTVTCLGIVAVKDLVAHADRVADPTAMTALELIQRTTDRAVLVKAIDRLPPREQTVVRMYYFMDVEFKVIATELGVGQPRVSQLHARAITRLKAFLKADQQEAA